MLEIAGAKENNQLNWIYKIPTYFKQIGLESVSFCFRHGFQRGLYHLICSHAKKLISQELSKEQCAHHLNWSKSLYKYHGTKSSFFKYFEASLLVQMGKHGLAISILEGLVDSEKKANHYLLLALCYKESDQQTETLKALKCAYLFSKQLKKSEKEELFKIYQELLLVVPLKVIQEEAIELSKIQTETALIEEGVKQKETIEQLIENKAYDAALQSLALLVKKEPSEAHWLYLTAYCYFALKECELSKKYLEEAISIQEDKDYFHLMYRILLKKRLYSSALHYLDRALELEPNNEELMNQKCWFKWHYSRKLPQA